MPRPLTNLEPFREDIQRRILIQKQSQEEILKWLKGKNIHCSKRSLIRRCKEWEASRWTTSSPSNSSLLEAIQNAFNTTFDSDEAIAQKLNSQGLQTTPNQVQEIRLKYGWRRRAANAEQLEAQRTETFTRVKGLLKEGSIRQNGREFVQTTLRVEQHYQAREDDVRDALKAFDPKGIELLANLALANVANVVESILSEDLTGYGL